MTEESNPILNHVEPSRRGFVKSVIAGAAFAAPVIAAFSIEGLGVEPAYAQLHASCSASSSSATGSGGLGYLDVGYVGPALFQAYVLDISGNTRVNGQVTISVHDRGDAADVELRITRDVQISSLTIQVNACNVASVELKPDNDDFRGFRYRGTITATDLSGFSDFNAFLQAMAWQTETSLLQAVASLSTNPPSPVTAVVFGTYSSTSFNAQGTVIPVPGPTVHTRG